MERENEVHIEAMNYEEENPTSSIIDAFEAGVKYADEHPVSPWVSVTDYLPSALPYKAESAPVIVRYEDGDTAIDIFDWDYADWQDGRENDEKITHWMEFPKLHEEEDRRSVA